MTAKLVLRAARDGRAGGKAFKPGDEVDVSSWPQVALEHYSGRGWLVGLDGKPVDIKALFPKPKPVETPAPTAEEPKAEGV